MACLCEPVTAKVIIGDIINEHRPIQPCLPIGCVINNLVSLYLEDRKNLLTGVTILTSSTSYEIPEDKYWGIHFRDIVPIRDESPDIIIYISEGSDFGEKLDEWLAAYRMQMIFDEDEEEVEDDEEENDEEVMPELEAQRVPHIDLIGLLMAGGVLVPGYEELANLENVDKPLENKTLLQKIEKTKEQCSICFDTPDSKCYKTPCNHYYCVECLDNWLKINKTCPVCRHELDKPLS